MAVQRVLIIEDNLMNMELALALLEEVGCEALEATTAEDGIEQAKATHPDLILMDVSLPGMDGLSATRLLKADEGTRDIPIIVMTAHAMRGDEAKALETGCDGYLTKPINTRAFMEIVTRFLQEAAASQAPAAPEADVLQEPASSFAETGSVLVVEDDPANRELLESQLVALGYQVETAEDGIRALERLQNRDPDSLPDVVLLDVMMPVLDGFEVLRAVRLDPAISDLPVIMVTALTSQEDRLHAVQAGANDFIAKPFDKTELQVRVASVMKMKKGQDSIKQHGAELEQTVADRTVALEQALAEVTAAQRATHEAYLDTIYRLAVASEYKDQDTANHIHRVSNYCALLARHLNLPAEEEAILCAASPMHDVGKLGIPDAILLKPEKLTPEERLVMQEHSRIGARILGGSNSKLLQAGEIISLSHHERWDGTGYPDGLSGKDIPLWGRICAIADVFDALTNDRPYKVAYSNEQAFQILLEDRGRQFDPELLDIFLSIKDEIAAIRSGGPA